MLERIIQFALTQRMLMLLTIALGGTAKAMAWASVMATMVFALAHGVFPSGGQIAEVEERPDRLRSGLVRVEPLGDEHGEERDCVGTRHRRASPMAASRAVRSSGLILSLLSAMSFSVW